MESVYALRNSSALVLLPCSARKPYSSSQSHRFFRSAIRDRSVHQVMVTSPLGLVPRELEEQWPAAHYDVPVTGQWDDDELATIRRLVRGLVERVGYKTVINHSALNLILIRLIHAPKASGLLQKPLAMSFEMQLNRFPKIDV